MLTVRIRRGQTVRTWLCTGTVSCRQDWLIVPRKMSTSMSDIEVSQADVTQALKQHRTSLLAPDLLQSLTVKTAMRMLEELMGKEPGSLQLHKAYLKEKLTKMVSKAIAASDAGQDSGSPNGSKENDHTGNSVGSGGKRPRPIEPATKPKVKVAASASGGSGSEVDKAKRKELGVGNKKARVEIVPQSTGGKAVKSQQKSDEAAGSSKAKKRQAKDEARVDVEEEDSDAASSSGGEGSDEEQEQARQKKVKKGKAVPVAAESTAAPNKKLEQCKAICKAATITIGPNLYKQHKGDEEGLQGALEALLDKHGLSRQSTPPEIAVVKRRLAKARDLDGIDTSNIVATDGRRPRRAAAITDFKALYARQGRSSDEEDSDDFEEVKAKPAAAAKSKSQSKTAATAPMTNSSPSSKPLQQKQPKQEEVEDSKEEVLEDSDASEEALGSKQRSKPKAVLTDDASEDSESPEAVGALQDGSGSESADEEDGEGAVGSDEGKVRTKGGNTGKHVGGGSKRRQVVDSEPEDGSGDEDDSDAGNSDGSGSEYEEEEEN